MSETIRYDRDAEGVVTLLIDDPDVRANTMNAAFRSSLSRVVERVRAELDSVTGVILASGKSTFFAGGDLQELVEVDDRAALDFSTVVSKLKSDLRALETMGVPVVAAIDGAALGGGLEIALSAHWRIAVDAPETVLGLPEVTLGLLPGAGGVARTVRLLGVKRALSEVLLTGRRYPASHALTVGLVDELAERDELLCRAKAWILDHPGSAQRWDQPHYQMPGGTPSSERLAAVLPALTAQLRRDLKGAPQPAPSHILSAAVEGSQVDLDSALRIEGRYFISLVRSQVAKNMIQVNWFDTNAIRAGASRPAGHEESNVSKVGIVGAGMMGAAIAHVSALAGIDVALMDVSVEAAERGKSYSRKLLDRAIASSATTRADADEVLARISPVADYGSFDECDLVIEAVLESVDLKKEVLAEVAAHTPATTLLSSNTSSLPISGLARSVGRPDDFLGLHFFSPVDRMVLLEIVRGEKTSDAALARAFDFAKQIGKTPIVVNDSRGFFTSRVLGVFVYEALAMLTEGVAPSTIERSALQAGYPVGALQLCDELNLELLLKIRNETRDGSRETYRRHPAEVVIERMVEIGRAGRLGGAGFYDYDESGRRAGLWQGLTREYPSVADPSSISVAGLSSRLLMIEAVETAHCLAEGVLQETADANVGSVLGIGFPVWTGGASQYVEAYPGGVRGFVAAADRLADEVDERFRPPAELRRRAEASPAPADM